MAALDVRSAPAARGSLRAGIIAAAAVLAAGCAAGPASHRDQLSVRDRQWQQNIAYVARELPRVHVHGLTGTTRSRWNSAATRLEAQVPKLTGGQLFAGLAAMVAMLHDDETQLLMPSDPVYPFRATWVGAGLYLTALPAADRGLLGGRLAAIDGHPIGVVLARLAAEIDYQDPGLERALVTGFDGSATQSPGYLSNAGLLDWLGLTSSPDQATFTVVTRPGRSEAMRLLSSGPGGGTDLAVAMAQVPVPLYQRRQDAYYWLTILAAHHAVYLKYNSCVDDDGFQRLAAQAIAILRAHPDYRLIVDLRDNPGGDTTPFMTLVQAIMADPAIDRPGRVIGLVNGLTDSSATLDASNLAEDTDAVLIGQPPADPVDEFGDNNAVLRLPYFGILVQYTTAVVNPGMSRLGLPGIVLAPTVADLLTGKDPVLAAALAYRQQASRR